MGAVKTIIVCLTILFTLYCLGVFNMILQFALNSIPSLSSIIRIKEVPDQAPADPMAGAAGMAKVDQIIASKKIEMSSQMKQVLFGLEDLIKDMNLDSLSEQDRQDALAELREKFPVMEATLSKSFEMDGDIGVDPAITVDHQKRLASIKILLDETEQKSGSQIPKREEKILEQENSHKLKEEEDLPSATDEFSSKSEFENNISDHASKPNEIKKDNHVSDPLEEANVHKNENAHTEL